MISRNQPRQTKAEKERNDKLKQTHCILCALAGDFKKRRLEIHHIVRGNKRLGHWYTLQLCAGHHQSKWTDQAIRVGIKSGRHAFREQYGYDELELWQRQQVALGLDDELPKTKIVPRRLNGGSRHVFTPPMGDLEALAAEAPDAAVPTGGAADGLGDRGAAS